MISENINVSNEAFKLNNEYIAQTYNKFPIEIKSGKGSIVKGYNNKKYIDFGSGIAVNTFGYNDKIWKNAVIKQINKIAHTSNLFYSKPCCKLAEMLCKKTNLKKVFFSNSGAEANECAIKVARKYGEKYLGKEYYNIITLKNSFHGRTLATLSATGQDVFHKQFLPMPDGFLYAEANNLEQIKNLIENYKVCACMCEIVQGEGGVIPLEKKFIEDLRKLTEENKILLIIDEVQTGNGRTGKLYSYMNYEIQPDIVTTAKGLGGGLPIAATLLNEKVENIFEYGDNGSTFGGNPVACAGAISILKRLDKEFLISVKNKSEFMFAVLEKCKNIKNITGKGLMIGFETIKNIDDVINSCMQNGLIVLKAKNKIRLLPPLNISYKNIKKGLNILLNACE